MESPSNYAKQKLCTVKKFTYNERFLRPIYMKDHKEYRGTVDKSAMQIKFSESLCKTKNC